MPALLSQDLGLLMSFLVVGSHGGGSWPPHLCSVLAFLTSLSGDCTLDHSSLALQPARGGREQALRREVSGETSVGVLGL